MKTNIIWSIILISLISCQNNSKSNLAITNDTTTLSKTMKQDILTTNSDFDDFYLNFITDSIFQKQHIKFPLKDAIGECDTLITLNNKDWKFDPNDIRKYDKSMDSLVVNQKEMECHLTLIRKEIGTLYEYKFKKINGTWYLVYYFINAC